MYNKRDINITSTNQEYYLKTQFEYEDKEFEIHWNEDHHCNNHLSCKNTKVDLNPNRVGFLRVCFAMGCKINPLSKTRQNYARNWKFGT